MRLIWSPLAIERVSEIAEYIAQDNLSAAQRWVDSIFQVVEQLEKFPEIGRIVPEINQESFREIIYGNYRIIYRLDGENIAILTVRHGKQILPIDEIKA